MQGLDISSYQRDINVGSLKSLGYDFVILRVSEGRTIADDKFNDFYNSAKAAGLRIGAYVYSHADSEERAKDEVNFARSLIKGRELPLGLYIDIEGDMLSMSNERLRKVTSAFIRSVESAGYQSGIYSSELTGWAKISSSDFPNSFVWVAQYSREPRIPCDIWQKTEKGTVVGYVGNVDVDVVKSERFKNIVNGKVVQEQEVKSTSVESIINSAVGQMESWAKDDSHGYDQQYRWGERGDFDCSAAVIQAWQNAGVPVK